jgi:hypothetical protein
MAVKDTKKKVMGKVSALNKLTDKGNNRVDGIKSKVNSNKEAINNKKNNVMEFITNLAMAITSFEDLKKSITDVIANQLPKTESVIKNELKKQLKELVSCSVDPSLPLWLINDGINLNVSKIDFYSMFKTSPESLGGGMVYNDAANKLNSTDLNTFLYYVIENNKSVATDAGVYYPWGTSVVNKALLDVKFNPVTSIPVVLNPLNPILNPSMGPTTTNIFNFKVNPASQNMKLTEFNNALVDSISLFGKSGSDKVIIKLMQDMFGTLNKMIPKPKAQIIEEEKMRKTLECITNAEAEVDDSFFTFSNEDLVLIDREANNKKNGVRVLECCSQNVLSLTPEDLNAVQTDIQNSINTPPPGFTAETAKIASVSRSIDNLATKAIGVNIDPLDFSNLRMNFILDMIKNYATSLVSYIISPKLLVVFAINHQLIYGQGAQYRDGIDFLEKNKNMLKPIFDEIKKVLIKMIIRLIIKKLSAKIGEKIKDDAIEKNKAYLTQLKILNGITKATELMISSL